MNAIRLQVALDIVMIAVWLFMAPVHFSRGDYPWTGIAVLFVVLGIVMLSRDLRRLKAHHLYQEEVRRQMRDE